MAKDKYTATELVHMLGAKYSQQKGYAFFSEIAPGLGALRRTDGFAIGLYASHGHPTIGFEIKVSRGDWLAELKDPSKSDEMFQYCSQWYLVAAPGVCEKEELPSTWGLMEPASRGLKIVVKSPETERKLMPVEFLSVILRRDCDRSKSYDWVPRTKVNEEIKKVVERELEWKALGAKRDVQHAQRELERMKQLYAEKSDVITKFSELTGISISQPTNSRLVKIVRLFGEDVDLSHVLDRLATAQRCSEDSSKKLSEAIQVLEALLSEERQACLT